MKPEISFFPGSGTDHSRRGGRALSRPLAVMTKRLHEDEDCCRRERSLRAVLEHLPFPVVVHALPPGGRIMLVNRKFVETFGYTAEEVGTVVDWAHRAYPVESYRAEVGARWSAAVRRAVKGNGVVGDQEFRVVAKDGAVHDVILNGTVVQDRLVVVLRDVTEKKKRYADREVERNAVEKIAYDLTENIPVGTYTMVQPPEGGLAKFSFMSRRFLELTGLKPEDAQEDPLKGFACVHPDDYEEWVRKNTEAFEQKRPFKAECRVVVKGETRWITAESTPRTGPDGTTVWEGVLTDITGQKQAEEELRQSREELAEAKEHYRLLAENAADVVMQCDSANRITWITPSVTLLTGWAPEKLIGCFCKDFVHPDDHDTFAAVESNVTGGSPGQAQMRFRASRGGYHWIDLSLRPIFDEKGAVTGSVAGWRDVQKEMQTHEALVLERQRLKATLDGLLDPHVMLEAVRDEEGRTVDFLVTEANPAACAYHRTTRDQLVGRPFLVSFPHHKASGVFEMYRSTMTSGHPLVLNDFEYPDEICGTGRRFDIRAVKVDGSLSCTWRDVTDRYEAARRLAESEEHYRLLARNAYGTVVKTDDHGAIRWISGSLEAVLGYRPEEWVGRMVTAIIEPESVPQLTEDLRKLARGEPVVARYRVKDKQGGGHWMESFASPYIDAQGEANGVVSTFHLVDAQVAAEEELERRARTDELTNLLNRKAVLERLDHLKGNQHRHGERLAVLFCDLDKFKTVNDTHGHQVGDEVLRLTAERLRGCLRTSDDLGARVGGDEMMIVLHGVRDLADAMEVAEKLRGSVAEPMPTGAGPLKVTMSVGVTLARQGENTAGIIARADDAMYQAKQTGRNQVIAIPPEESAPNC